MMYDIGGSTYDSSKRELIGPTKKKRTFSDGRYKFMMCLLKIPNELVPKDEFLAAFGNVENVRSFKKKLNDTLKMVDPSLNIETKYGKGYTLKGVEVRSD